jgi:VWFA-related protein
MSSQPPRMATTLIYAISAVAVLATPPCRAQSSDGPVTPPSTVAIQQAPPQAPVKVQVTLVNTPVVVRNNKGEMIHNLDVKDFRVTDNGVLQTITHFDIGTEPVSMVVLIENSSRVESLLPEIRKTGILFTQTVLGPRGEAAVVTFNTQVDKLQDFTSNADQIESTIAQIPAGINGAKLYDAMATAVEMLSSRPQSTADQVPTRRILMIVAEAVDVGSATRLGEILQKAQRASVTIYSVGLSTIHAELKNRRPPDTQQPMTPPGVSSRPGFPGSAATPDNQAEMSGVDLTALAKIAVQHAEDLAKGQILQAAAAATGGLHLSAFHDRSIQKAIDEIGGELHTQYNVSYTPTHSDASGYHAIDVTVDQKKLTVRARPGYYLP